MYYLEAAPQLLDIRILNLDIVVEVVRNMLVWCNYCRLCRAIVRHVLYSHTTLKQHAKQYTRMYSQYTTASRMAGNEQQSSGIRFTSMWKTVPSLGAPFGGCLDRTVEAADGRLPPYRRLADGDGH